MGRYIAKRLIYMVIVFFLLTFILFSLYQLMPANRAYTEAKAEILTMKKLSDEEKDTKFDELYLKYKRLYGTDPLSAVAGSVSSCRGSVQDRPRL